MFRPHAWYYFFLHPEVRKMLPPSELQAFLHRLESGEVQPKMIVMDNNLRQLSDQFVVFVQKHYEDVGNDIWVRNPEGLDARKMTPAVGDSASVPRMAPNQSEPAR